MKRLEITLDVPDEVYQPTLDIVAGAIVSGHGATITDSQGYAVDVVVVDFTEYDLGRTR